MRSAGRGRPSTSTALPEQSLNYSRTGEWESFQRLDDGSRMSREVHVRFCEGPGVRLPWPTHPYIRMWRGFIYLVAIIDWFSRFVLAWELSTTLDAGFCMSALDWALASGRRPEIFNTDQGAQFTSDEFTGRLIDKSILISMDGRGRALDNIFVERLWRTVKYEEIYLNDYSSVDIAISRLGSYFEF